MDLALRQLDRLAAGGDPEAKNRAARMRCRMGEHDWNTEWPDWLTNSGLYEYKLSSYPPVCSACGRQKGPIIFCDPPYDYSSAEFRILEYADSDVWATTEFYRSFSTTTTSTPFLEEEDPRTGGPPPYAWHPTKKRPWQRAGYRKRIKARRKRNRQRK